MDLVSVIVPVYNVEQYIRACVESLIAQSYRNLDIILVDDGSTDQSGELCEALAREDARIRVLHKINGGLSDARNYGMEYVAGQYVMFVDSDDVVDKEIVARLHTLIAAYPNVALAVCGLSHFYDGDVPAFSYDDTIAVMERDEALVDFLYQKRIPTSACGKLYLKESLDAVRFVKGQRFEDNEFVFKVLLESRRVVYSASGLYAYRHRHNSITTAAFDEKEFDIIRIGQKIMEETASLDDRIKMAALAYQCTNCFRLYVTASAEFVNSAEFSYCKDFLKKNAGETFRDPGVRKKLKMGLMLFRVRTPRAVLRYIRSKKSRWS